MSGADVLIGEMPPAHKTFKIQWFKSTGAVDPRFFRQHGLSPETTLCTRGTINDKVVSGTAWMPESESCMSFSGLWRKIGDFILGNSNELPLKASSPPARLPSSESIETKRSYFLRPFARQDAAIASLQRGFNGLYDLLTGLQENLDRLNRRQEEIISYLSHIPELIQTLPETNRNQADAMRNLNRHIQDNASQQKLLSDMVVKVGENSREQQAAIETLALRVDTVVENGDRLLSSIRQVCSSINAMNQSNDSNTQIVRHIQDALRRQDESMEAAFLRQNSRLTTWLALSFGLTFFCMAGIGTILFIYMKK
jgi:hypothetical protein